MEPLPLFKIANPFGFLSPSATPAVPTPAPALPPLREFGNARELRQSVYERTLNAARSIEPLSVGNVTLKLKDVNWKDPERFSKRERKEALLTGGSLSRRMEGTWELSDAAGAVLDSRKQVVGAVPYITGTGTILHRGTDYTVNHQKRLLPGIYARERGNGELESYVNALPGKGASHRYFIDPAKQLFKVRIQQAEMPLLPILHALGATDDDVRKAWGTDIWAANQTRLDSTAPQRFAEKLVRKADMAKPGEMTEKLRAAIEGTELDPEVMQSTLGAPHKNLNKDVILAATKKLLAINRGEADIDDRDHLAYQKIVGPEDLFAERIEKDHGGVRRSIFKKLAIAKSLAKMPSGLLTQQMNQVLTGSGLANPLEEINPAEILDKQSRITSMGEGGLGSLDAIPAESRSVQPSHLNYIDLLRTPESLRAGIDLHLARSARKGGHKLYSPFRNQQTGNIEMKTPQEMRTAALTTPEMFTDPFWSTVKRVPVLRDGNIGYVKRGDVDYVVPDFEESFSHLGNLVPLKSGVKGQRVAMASRMLTQALPLVNAEAPLVQAGLKGTNGTRSYDDEYGRHLGAVAADKGGRVIGVSGDGIKVMWDDGTRDEIDLHNNLPMNRKSVTGSTRVWVKRRRTGELWEGAISDYRHIAGDQVWSIDVKTKRSAWCDVTGFIRHENDKRLVRVNTASGRSVCVTVDHSLVTLDENGELTPILPEDCVLKRTRLPVVMLPSPNDVADVDIDRAILSGLYLAEGHCSAQAGNVQIAVEPDDRAAQVFELLQRLGEHPYRSGGSVAFTGHNIRGWLLDRFGHMSGRKFIPPSVFRWAAPARAALLQGYFAGDGCLWADGNGAIQVAAVSTSRRLRDGLMALLSTFGIFSAPFDAPRQHINDAWADAYGLRVISPHLCKLPRWFFYNDREAKFQNLLRDKYRASYFAGLPIVSKSARRRLYAELPGKTPHFIYKTTTDKGFVSKDRIVTCTGVFGAWARSDIMWDVVETIETIPHEAYVYDFCVKDSEVFAVDHGLVVHNTLLNQTPLVQAGQEFKKGDILARSNFTDEKGTAALGINPRMAYMPWEGLNFEDAIAISESMAKKLTSEHAYQHELELTPEHKSGKNAFINLFPGRFDRKTLDVLDDKGVIKPGSVVEPGQPLILAAKEKSRSQNKIHKRRQPGYADESVVWDHHDSGVVTDVAWGKTGPVVVVKSLQPMRQGDKLSGRYGDKGVVSAIIPDDQMPVGADGQPLELIANDLGTISRTNPAQHVEGQLGKIAALLGKAMKVPDFDNQGDMVAWAKEQLDKHGLQDMEDLYLPKYGRTVKAQTGRRFFMKLHHTSESKTGARGGGGYSADDTPAKGGASGSKRIGMLVSNALLSHGAIETLKDIRNIRGQKQEQWWLQFMQGHSPTATNTPLTFQKTMDYLRASGIHVGDSKGRVHIKALTNKDIDELAGDRNIQNGETVNFDDELKPIKNGLFDEQLTGGHNARKFSAIPLPEPLPNPAFEEPIRRVLGLTQKQLYGVLAGEQPLGQHGTGSPAIANALGKINLDAELTRAESEWRYGRGQKREDAVRRWGFLKGAKDNELHPKDWMISRAPVLPTAFRPVNLMGNGVPLVSDPNYLYKHLIESANLFRKLKSAVGEGGAGQERLGVYQALKATVGLGEPTHPKLVEKNVHGLLKSVFGDSPKYGMYQRKLLATTVDNVGRGVIVPNPDLDIDSIGIPENQAFPVYAKFIVRDLKRKGLPIREALRHVLDRTDLARKTLVEEMDRRPVYMDRAPVLHKFGIMALKPRLVSGDVIHMAPLLTKSYGADFDGDTVNFHVPSSDAAVREAYERMLPSRSLLSPGDFKTPNYMPSQEYLAGLYRATKEPKADKSKRARVFRNIKDALGAFARGDITDIHQAVEILEHAR